MSSRAIPALNAYITRIGAEELNFKRYIVRDYRGAYYIERCIIRIMADGEIKCSNPDYGPTADEAAKIKGALMGVEWPRAILARNIDALREKLRKDSVVFEFNSREEKGIIMVQERANIKGKKTFLPWTFWSDGEWRCMEPEGALPFWTPEPTNLGRIMIHEGAKAARFVTQLIKNKDDHPWLDELTKYEHWGMIGGALAPHRTDYAMLRKEKPVEIIYVCDNDRPGKSALQKISRAYGGSMKGIKFDDSFPASWDLADKMPKQFFKGKRYIGKKLYQFIEPATFATEKVPTGDGKKTMIELRQNFKEEWCHAITPEIFIHLDSPSHILSANEFNSKVSPFSEVDDTARLLKKDGTSKAVMLNYNPAMPPGLYTIDTGGKYINTHIPSAIEAEKGSAKPFLEFMNNLVEDETDRHELMRWCATLIACPQIKMLYGVLLISETQGIGKGTLGEKILAPIIGINNSSFPSENEIVNSNYNYWCSHKRLAVVHEIYAGHSAKGYNQLKSIITDRYITVQKKYQSNYDIENWMHVFACSNSIRALKLSNDDRRWFVPKISENKQTRSYWYELNEWLTFGGLGIVKTWAHDFVKKHGSVMPGEVAPWSAMKEEVIDEGLSPGQTLVVDALKCLKNEMNGHAVFFTDSDCIKLIHEQIYEGRHSDRLEKPSTIRKLARAKGWHINPKRAYVKEWNTLAHGPRLICSSPEDAGTAPGDLFLQGRNPIKLTDFYNKVKGL
jgi:hypothetical protein